MGRHQAQFFVRNRCLINSEKQEDLLNSSWASLWDRSQSSRQNGQHSRPRSYSSSLHLKGHLITSWQWISQQPRVHLAFCPLYATRSRVILMVHNTTESVPNFTSNLLLPATLKFSPLILRLHQVLFPLVREPHLHMLLELLLCDGLNLPAPKWPHKEVILV